MTLVVRTRPLDGPIDLVSALPSRSGGPRQVLLHGESGLVASGVAARIPVGTGPERLRRAHDELARLAGASTVEDEVRTAGTGLVAIGSFTFDPSTEGSTLTIPRVLVGRRDGVAWRTEVSAPASEEPHAGAPGDPPVGDPDRVRFGGSTVRDEDWLRAVAVALERIRAGELEKIVLARDQLLWSRRPFDTDALVTRLHARFPGCHVFAVDGLVGASPELLLGQRGLDVASRVLAGTTARGHAADDDHRLGAVLLGSGKDRREHALAVASVRDVLAPVCDRLEVPDAPELLLLPNVQHLATAVAGRLTAPLPGLALLDRLHPTAAVGGTPRAAALAAIRELEGMSRGRYAGPVGWTDAAGNGDWAIALRCAEVDGTRARLMAGAGVVAGSLPEQELLETTLKLAAMRSVLDGASS